MMYISIIPYIRFLFNTCYVPHVRVFIYVYCVYVCLCVCVRERECVCVCARARVRACTQVRIAVELHHGRRLNIPDVGCGSSSWQEGTSVPLF